MITFCKPHWRKVRAARNANSIVATIEITRRFVERLDADQGPLTAVQMGELFDTLGPPCCYLGDGVVDEVILVAQVATSGALG